MYFPVYIDLTEKEILIVGAGAIGTRRVRTLCGFAGGMTVVAPRIRREVELLAGRYPIVLRPRAFREEDLEGMDVVLAATDDPECNDMIFRLCRERGIPVNVCSSRFQCDFQFPSVIQTGGVVIGINASGENHSLVKETRQRLERLLQVPEADRKYMEMQASDDAGKTEGKQE